MTAAPPGRFSAASRLRKRRDFLRVQESPTRAVTAHLVFLWTRREPADGPSTQPRLGLTVPKRTGSAPLRSRAKRLLRAAFRAKRSLMPLDTDLVVVVRRPLGEAGLQGVLGEWERFLRKLLGTGSSPRA